MTEDDAKTPQCRVLTPYGEMIAEMERKANGKRTIAERIARWFDRPQREPERPGDTQVDCFVWHDVADLIERGGQ